MDYKEECRLVAIWTLRDALKITWEEAEDLLHNLSVYFGCIFKDKEE